MYCSILITVSQEEDSNLHMQGCQVCTVPFSSQYHKNRIPTYICRGVRYVLFHSDHSITRRGFQLTYASLFLWYCDQNGTVHTWHPWICKLGSSSFVTVIRMEQYKPDIGIPFLWYCDQKFHLAYARVSGMYCSILITVSQEEDSNVHMQGFQVCTVPFWSQYH
jgi:hypothetical protein